ncbi:3707_t:CDS:2, partial [Entrophospora sp. SA101]
FRFFNSSNLNGNGEKTMTAKFKELTKRYGTSALAVYFIISTIDLGTTFILIQSGGAERVKRIEDWCIENFGAGSSSSVLLSEEVPGIIVDGSSSLPSL